jgi:hypothetical protein
MRLFGKLDTAALSRIFYNLFITRKPYCEWNSKYRFALFNMIRVTFSNLNNFLILLIDCVEEQRMLDLNNTINNSKASAKSGGISLTKQ